MKKFSCHFENTRTGERRDLISALNAKEIEVVERARQTDGDEIAQVTAAAIVLRSAYSEVDAREWVHLGAPQLLN
jgi:hypothetical protein